MMDPELYQSHTVQFEGSGIPPARPSDPNAFQADRFLLVAPLWNEEGRHRVIIGAYRTETVPLPEDAKVCRVLVPDRVEVVETDNPFSDERGDPAWGILSAPRHFKKPVPTGPWHEVKYTLEEHDGILLIRPERTADDIFAAEADLPTRDGWVRIALTPGNWLVLLGWSKEFNLLTVDGKTVFRGRVPYNEVKYDLDGVSMVFWYCGYAIDLKGYKWFKDVFNSGTSRECWLMLHYIDNLVSSKSNKASTDILNFHPLLQYKIGILYGPGIILRINTRNPIIIEFKAPKPRDYIKYGYKEFYSDKYWSNSLSPLEVIVSQILYGVICPVITPPILLIHRRRR